MVELICGIHKFIAGDTFHSQSKEILSFLKLLENLVHLIQEKEHYNDTRAHRERLAIAFEIINTKPGTAIRIIKKSSFTRHHDTAARTFLLAGGRGCGNTGKKGVGVAKQSHGSLNNKLDNEATAPTPPLHIFEKSCDNYSF
ncbi:hypothetical protein EJ110_NYTH22175 [Nymphaea thermarum]|nr:hypothetical protein EJ110_NYTH22175 [Nymphaea thermarum]